MRGIEWRLFHQNRPVSSRDLMGGRIGPPHHHHQLTYSRNPTSNRVKGPFAQGNIVRIKLSRLCMAVYGHQKKLPDALAPLWHYLISAPASVTLVSTCGPLVISSAHISAGMLFLSFVMPISQLEWEYGFDRVAFVALLFPASTVFIAWWMA